jgi:hypothetical protein
MNGYVIVWILTSAVLSVNGDVNIVNPSEFYISFLTAAPAECEVKKNEDIDYINNVMMPKIQATGLQPPNDFRIDVKCMKAFKGA